jgi:amino acid transporter
MTTSSRITHAFARDKGLPFSKFFATVDKRFDVPINSLILTSIIVAVFGCIYLGSSSALNAILSASVVALGVSYGIPIGVLVCRGRSILPQERQFRMGNLVGWISNIVSLIFIAFTTILFLLPPQIPVTPSNMNYTIVVFGILFIVALLQWILDGRKNYHGPHVSVLGGNVQTKNDLA